MDIAGAMALLQRGAETIVPEGGLEQKLRQAESDGRQLRVKLGVDPSSADLHIGHAVVLRKMRQFQDLGHRVVLIVGDFTATIGDPSGRSKTRPVLSLEQTRVNGETYVAQATRILDDDPQRLEIRHNSEWLAPLGFGEVVRLASSYTVARMLERDDFTKRFRSGTPIWVHELLYPLAQAYDSVALSADVELGGTDQLFNLLVGRDVQRDYDQEPQIVADDTRCWRVSTASRRCRSRWATTSGSPSRPRSCSRRRCRCPTPCCCATRSSAPCSICRPSPPKPSATRSLPTARSRASSRVPTMAAGRSKRRRRATTTWRAAASRTTCPRPWCRSSELEGGRVGVLRLATLAGLTASNGEARRLIQNRGLRLDGDVVDDPRCGSSSTSRWCSRRGRTPSCVCAARAEARVRRPTRYGCAARAEVRGVARAEARAG